MSLDENEMDEMKELLKRDELARMGRDDNVKEGAKLDDINSFKPVCQEMKANIPAFVEWKSSRFK